MDGDEILEHLLPDIAGKLFESGWRRRAEAL
jgi:hypothetical protein